MQSLAAFFMDFWWLPARRWTKVQHNLNDPASIQSGTLEVDKMTKPTRRQFTASVAAGVLCSTTAANAVTLKANPIGLGFSLYGMRSLKVVDALRTVKRIGYDCVELTVTAGWPADTAMLSKGDRRSIADTLKDTSLRLSSLMEHLYAVVDDKKHTFNLDRIKVAGELAHQLSPTRPPVIETVLGGRSSEWEATKHKIVDRLHDWAKAAESVRTVIAIKAHVGGAMHLPEHPVWIVEQLKSPWIKCVYDYSHFKLSDVDMAKSVTTLVPHAAFVHIKDGHRVDGRVQFQLPGEGSVDCAELLALISAAGYAGDVVAEVSGQIHGKPGYDPVATATKCYNHLSAAFAKAGIKRA